MTEQPRCETCRYWESQFRDTDGRIVPALDGFGRCLRFPPHHPTELDGFPASHKDDWCGEHQR